MALLENKEVPDMYNGTSNASCSRITPMPERPVAHVSGRHISSTKRCSQLKGHPGRHCCQHACQTVVYAVCRHTYRCMLATEHSPCPRSSLCLTGPLERKAPNV
jgi:hypothetical protein